MNKSFTILISGLQAAVAFVVLVSIYMVGALADSDFGFDGLFGLVLIHPIIAAILSLLSIFVCFLAGLPIRINKKINAWWIAHFYISLIGLMAGLTFFVLAFVPDFQETVTVYIAWFLTAFSLLHLYPPAPVTKKIKGGLLVMNVWKKIKR